MSDNMRGNTTIIFAVLGAVLLALVFFAGQQSVGKNTEIATSTSATETSNSAPTAKPTVPQTETVSAAQPSVITNSEPCLMIAKASASNQEARGVANEIVVKQAHFKNGACFYQLSFDYYVGSEKTSSTIIFAAPNETIVAYCGYSASRGTTCFNESSNPITEATFYLIAANLLTN